MAQPRRGARFASEALEEFGIVGELGVQQFDRDVAIEQRVLRLPDHGHAAASDLANQPIAPAEDAVGARELTGD